MSTIENCHIDFLIAETKYAVNKLAKSLKLLIVLNCCFGAWSIIWKKNMVTDIRKYGIIFTDNQQPKSIGYDGLKHLPAKTCPVGILKPYCCNDSTICYMQLFFCVHYETICAQDAVQSTPTSQNKFRN